MQYMNAECNYVWCCVQIYHINTIPISCQYNYWPELMPFHRHSYHCLVTLPICADLEFQKPTEFKRELRVWVQTTGLKIDCKSIGNCKSKITSRVEYPTSKYNLRNPIRKQVDRGSLVFATANKVTSKTWAAGNAEGCLPLTKAASVPSGCRVLESLGTQSSGRWRAFRVQSPWEARHTIYLNAHSACWHWNSMRGVFAQPRLRWQEGGGKRDVTEFAGSKPHILLSPQKGRQFKK